MCEKPRASEHASRSEIEPLRRALLAQPDDPRHFVSLARLLAELGELGQAEDSLDAALRLDPADVEALLLKARLAEHQQQHHTAAELYHRVLACDPRNVPARLRLASLHLEAGVPERAGPLLRAVCQNSTAAPHEVAEARWQLGIAYGLEERWADAAVELAAALRLKPQPTGDELYRFAYARHRGGDAIGAAQVARLALKQDPQHAGAQALASIPPAESGATIGPPAVQFARAGSSPPAGW